MSDQNGESEVGAQAGSGMSVADDRKLDEFVDAIDDPETIRRRGEARSEEHDDAYYDRLAEQHKDQIADEMEGYREMGLLEDGGGQADPRPYVRRSPVAYRTPEERATDSAVASDGSWRPNATPVTDARKEAAADGLVSPGPGPEPAAPVAGPPAAAAPGDDWIGKFTDVHMSVMDDLTRAVENGINEIKAVAPRVGSDDLAALTGSVGKLEELLRVQASDVERKAEARRARWRWPLRAVAAIIGGALLVGGAAVQSRWPVLDDGTNGWKEIVWRAEGMKVAECMKKAATKGGGATCAISARVK